MFGRWNSLRIHTKYDVGLVKIHPWQLRLFKCVTPEDFYIVTGIYDALIKTKICEGYRNFGFSYNTYKKRERQKKAIQARIQRKQAQQKKMAELNKK